MEEVEFSVEKCAIELPLTEGLLCCDDERLKQVQVSASPAMRKGREVRRLWDRIDI